MSKKGGFCYPPVFANAFDLEAMHSLKAFSAFHRSAPPRLASKSLGLLAVFSIATGAFAQVPAITVPPTNTHAGVGNRISFAVSATGGAPLAYQWYFNGGSLSEGGRFSGTRSNVMTILSVRTNDAGNYSAVVSNASGTAPSGPAALIVHQLTPPPSGVVALWPAEGNANDALGANNGMPFGVSYAPGWIGQAFKFESQKGAYVWLPPSPIVDLTQMPNWTLAAWVRPSGSNFSGAPTIYSEGVWYASLGLDIYLGSANSLLNGANAAYSLDPVPSNQWTHVALVLTSTNRTFYINGARSGSTPNPLFVPTSAGAFIGGISGAPAFFDGLIDELAIYSRALSDAEVRAVAWPGSSNLPPLILQQPAGQALYAGDNAALTVGVAGTQPMVFQWRKEGTNLVEGGRITGSKTAQLSLSSIQHGDAGNYSVWITNIEGSVTSQVAVVTVQVRLPAITQQPQSLTLTQGSTASFTVAATSAVPVSYQWLFKSGPLSNGGQISGATSTNLVIANILPANAGSYTVAVSNAGGTTVSSPATLTVQSYPPVITTQPQGLTVGAGATVSFYVAATGLPPLSYQWRFNSNHLANGGQISGATSNFLTVANVQTNNTGNYTVVISNAHGAATSSPPAYLTVTAGPAITNAPVSQTPKLGDTVTFSVGANGSPPLSYQWRLNGQPIIGATNSVLTLTNVGPASAGFYDVVVSNASGSSISAAASLGFVDLKMFAGVIITGPVGAAYRIDYSPALADPPLWTPLTNVTLTASPYYFIDYASPGSPSRFYRAVPQP